jgi:hypothetical protein
MKEHGQQSKPLIITEYSILYPYEDDGGSCFLQDEFGNCFTPNRVSNYLRNTFDLIDGAGEMKDVNIGFPVDDYRLVQQILWWSINADNYPGASSNLYNEAITAPTTVGNAFIAEMAERTPTPNLKAWYATNVTGFINPPATTTTVTLSANIYNNGSLNAPDSVIATFYKDAAMNNVIDSVAIPSVSGCARDSVTVSVDWSGLTSGVHQYWVKVDSSGLLVEESESDNVNSGIVIIDPEQVFLPFSTK